MMSASGDEVRRCRICLQCYDTNGHLPRHLDCGHTFCATCITECLVGAVDQRTSIKCPTCKKSTHLDSDGVRGLDIDRDAMQLARQYSAKESIQITRNDPNFASATTSVLSAVKKSPGTKSDVNSNDVQVVFSNEGDKVKKKSHTTKTVVPLQCSACRKTIAEIKSKRCAHMMCMPCYKAQRSKTSNTLIECMLCKLSKSVTGPCNEGYVINAKSHHPLHPAPMSVDDENEEASDATNEVGCSAQENGRSGSCSSKKAAELTSSNVSAPTEEGSSTNAAKRESVSGDVYQITPNLCLVRNNTAPESLPPQSRNVDETKPVYLGRIGKYSDIRTQPGSFQAPTRISIASTRERNSTTVQVVVVDSINESVQIFTDSGDCLVMFRATGVKAACICSNDQLAIATNNGIDLYDVEGNQRKTLPLGGAINVCRYDYGRPTSTDACGFLAVHMRKLSLCTGRSGSTVKTIGARFTSGSRTSEQFWNIVDASSITGTADIAVLDIGASALFIMDDSGIVKSILRPSDQLCQPLSMPYSLVFDRAHGLIISDSGARCALQFFADGRFRRKLLVSDDSASGVGMEMFGVALDGTAGVLFVAVRGEQMAEVRKYRI